jgi:hypothetical protein
VHAWLKQEGYDSELLADDQAPLLAGTIFDVVKAFVDRAVYDVLLIYFSGRGYLKEYSEHWLLSKAPSNPDEAVSLAESFQLARDCGIPFVVFISDACRSTPQSLKADRVRCSLIFPNDGVSGQKRAKIDWLFACGPGNPAYEVTVDASSKQYAALFTSCLRKAFEDPPHERTKKTGSDEVLPNNALEELLPKMVDAVAQILSISLHRQAAGALRGVPGI